MRVELHPEARSELRAAALWYDEQRPRLGDELIAEVTQMMQRIEEAPGSFPLWPGVPAARQARLPIRRAVLQRFPYAIAIEPHEGYVRILAIAHTRRKPLYWIGRAY